MRSVLAKGCKENKGFTLVEMIVVMLLLSILLALSVGGLLAWQDWSDFNQANEYAETMFFAAQNQLSEYDANGTLSDFAKDAESANGVINLMKGTIIGTTTGTTKDTNANLTSIYYGDGEAYTAASVWKTSEEEQQGTLVSVRANKGDYALYKSAGEDATTSKTAPLVFQLLEQYFYDTSVLNDTICIEFSPSDGQVFGVLYSAKSDGDSNEAFEYNNKNDHVRGTVNIATRYESYRKDRMIGYYGADTLSHALKNEQVELDIENVKLHDEDTMYLTFDVSDPAAVLKLNYDITVCDAENNDAPVLKIELSGNHLENTATAQSCTVTRYEDGDKDKGVGLGTFPVLAWQKKNGSKAEIHVLLDAADIQASAASYVSQVVTNMEDGVLTDPDIIKNDSYTFKSTYSFHRFGIDVQKISCKVQGKDNGEGLYKDTAERSSIKPEFIYFADVEEDEADTSAITYKISNCRHLYNMRYLTDLSDSQLEKSNSRYNDTTHSDFKLVGNIDWAEFVKNGNYYNTEKNGITASEKASDGTAGYDISSDFISMKQLRATDSFTGVKDSSTSESEKNVSYTISNLTMTQMGNELSDLYSVASSSGDDSGSGDSGDNSGDSGDSGSDSGDSEEIWGSPSKVCYVTSKVNKWSWNGETYDFNFYISTGNYSLSNCKLVMRCPKNTKLYNDTWTPWNSTATVDNKENETIITFNDIEDINKAFGASIVFESEDSYKEFNIIQDIYFTYDGGDGLGQKTTSASLGATKTALFASSDPIRTYTILDMMISKSRNENDILTAVSGECYVTIKTIEKWDYNANIYFTVHNNSENNITDWHVVINLPDGTSKTIYPTYSKTVISGGSEDYWFHQSFASNTDRDSFSEENITLIYTGGDGKGSTGSDSSGGSSSGSEGSTSGGSTTTTTDTRKPVGLFVKNYGTISNINLEDVHVESTNNSGYAGAFCGILVCGTDTSGAATGTMENLAVLTSADVTSDSFDTTVKAVDKTYDAKKSGYSYVKADGAYVGGIIGYVEGFEKDGKATGLTLSNLTNEARVTGTSYVGGIVGELRTTKNIEIKVEDCKNYGAVYAVKDTDEEEDAVHHFIGGIVGLCANVSKNNDDSLITIEDCKSSPQYSTDDLKTLLGENGANLADDTTYTDSVVGDYVGGIVGYSYYATLTRVSATKKTTNNGNASAGYVIGRDYVGGIAGYYVASSATLSGADSSNDSGKNHNTVIGRTYVGGIVGANAKIDETNTKALASGSSTVLEAIEKSDEAQILSTNDKSTITVENWENDGIIYAVGTENTDKTENNGYAGGIAGYNTGTINACADTLTTEVYASASTYLQTDAVDYVGGIAGYNTGTINVATGITTARNGNDYVGGIAGYNEGTITTNGNNTVTITAANNYVGGIAGYNMGTITAENGDTQDTVTLTGKDYVGGIAGYNTSSTGKMIAASTSVNATLNGSNYVGGVVGYNDSGAAVRNYAVSGGSISGDSDGCYVGGLAGCNASWLLLQDDDGNAQKLSVSTQNISGGYYVGGVIGGNIINTKNYNKNTISDGSSTGSSSDLEDVMSVGQSTKQCYVTLKRGGIDGYPTSPTANYTINIVNESKVDMLDLRLEIHTKAGTVVNATALRWGFSYDDKNIIDTDTERIFVVYAGNGRDTLSAGGTYGDCSLQLTFTSLKDLYSFDLSDIALFYTGGDSNAVITPTGDYEITEDDFHEIDGVNDENININIQNTQDNNGTRQSSFTINNLSKYDIFDWKLEIPKDDIALDQYSGSEPKNWTGFLDFKYDSDNECYIVTPGDDTYCEDANIVKGLSVSRQFTFNFTFLRTDNIKFTYYTSDPNDKKTSGGSYKRIYADTTTNNNTISGTAFTGGSIGYAMFVTSDAKTIADELETTVKTNLSEVANKTSATQSVQLYVTGSVNSGTVTATGSYAGGFVGGVAKSTFLYAENAINNAAVTASGTNGYAGGILGNSAYKNNKILACTNNGTVTASNGYAGGMVGYSTAGISVAMNATSEGTNTTGCINSTNATITANGKSGAAGGMIGYLDGSEDDVTLTSCVNQASIVGNTYAGGMIGYLNAKSATFTECVNKGSISGNAGYVSEMVGNATISNGSVQYASCTNSSGTIIDNTSDTEVAETAVLAASELLAEDSFLTVASALASDSETVSSAQYACEATSESDESTALVSDAQDSAADEQEDTIAQTTETADTDSTTEVQTETVKLSAADTALLTANTRKTIYYNGTEWLTEPDAENETETTADLRLYSFTVQTGADYEKVQISDAGGAYGVLYLVPTDEDAQDAADGGKTDDTSDSTSADNSAESVAGYDIYYAGSGAQLTEESDFAANTFTAKVGTLTEEDDVNLPYTVTIQTADGTASYPVKLIYENGMVRLLLADTTDLVTLQACAYTEDEAVAAGNTTITSDAADSADGVTEASDTDTTITVYESSDLTVWRLDTVEEIVEIPTATGTDAVTVEKQQEVCEVVETEDGAEVLSDEAIKDGATLATTMPGITGVTEQTGTGDAVKKTVHYTIDTADRLLVQMIGYDADGKAVRVYYMMVDADQPEVAVDYDTWFGGKEIAKDTTIASVTMQFTRIDTHGLVNPTDAVTVDAAGVVQ